MKNKILTGLLLVLIGGWGSLSAQNVGSNYARQVNTLIGTKGVGLTSGYLYPGATYPYGMVQFTPSYFSKRSGFVINQLSRTVRRYANRSRKAPMRLSRRPA